VAKTLFDADVADHAFTLTTTSALYRAEPGDRHESAHALCDLIESREARVRPSGSKGADRAMDQCRELPPQRLIRKTKCFHHAGPEVLDDHVGASDEGEQSALPIVIT
jgi:hypothetical protein